MKPTGPLRGSRPASVAREFARFRSDQRGMMSLFSIFMVMVIMISCGLAADIMYNEMKRTQLQSLTDRAALAAADLDQSLDPASVVEDYFAKAGMADALKSTSVNESVVHRTVEVEAASTTPVIFTKLLSKDWGPMHATASSTAEERVGNIEISMVLDISGSMGRNQKMPNLRTAATNFIDSVISERSTDRVSLSLVPYTAQVNAGADIFGALQTHHKHNFSHCIEFENGDFANTKLDTNRRWQQGQHAEFSAYNSHSTRIDNPGCPVQSFETITAISQNKSALKSQVAQLRARANTSIHIGAKWGAALLDPSFRSVSDKLVAGGKISKTFEGRPVDYGKEDTLKTLILMTDGENVTTRRVADWAYQNSSHYAHWARYPVFYYLNNWVSSQYRSQYYYTRFSPQSADTYLKQVCDAAKAKNIVIWTVGFEVGDHGASVMEYCASSPNHFFRVDGDQIVSAFEAISRQINQLRLIQ